MTPKSSSPCSGLASYAYLISHFATKFKTWFDNGDREIHMEGEMGNEWGGGEKHKGGWRNGNKGGTYLHYIAIT